MRRLPTHGGLLLPVLPAADNAPSLFFEPRQGHLGGNRPHHNESLTQALRYAPATRILRIVAPSTLIYLGQILTAYAALGFADYTPQESKMVAKTIGWTMMMFVGLGLVGAGTWVGTHFIYKHSQNKRNKHLLPGAMVALSASSSGCIGGGQFLASRGISSNNIAMYIGGSIFEGVGLVASFWTLCRYFMLAELSEGYLEIPGRPQISNGLLAASMALYFRYVLTLQGIRVAKPVTIPLDFFALSLGLLSGMMHYSHEVRLRLFEHGIQEKKREELLLS